MRGRVVTTRVVEQPNEILEDIEAASSTKAVVFGSLAKD